MELNEQSEQLLKTHFAYSSERSADADDRIWVRVRVHSHKCHSLHSNQGLPGPFKNSCQ